MKISFIIIAVALYSSHCEAQLNNLSKNNPMEEFKRKQMLTEMLRKKQPEMNNYPFSQIRRTKNKEWVVKAELAGKYAGNNGKGANVYNMLPYNMPCLVPDKTFTCNMPVAGYDKTAQSFVSPFKEFGKETNGKK